jgi:hypothetical protein
MHFPQNPFASQKNLDMLRKIILLPLDCWDQGFEWGWEEGF